MCLSAHPPNRNWWWNSYFNVARYYFVVIVLNNTLPKANHVINTRLDTLDIKLFLKKQRKTFQVGCVTRLAVWILKAINNSGYRCHCDVLFPEDRNCPGSCQGLVRLTYKERPRLNPTESIRYQIIRQSWDPIEKRGKILINSLDILHFLVVSETISCFWR